MAFNRRRVFVKGLGALEVREVLPTPAAAFSNVGALKSVVINDVHTIVDVIADTGHRLNALSSEQKVSGVAELWQTSADEINLLRDAIAKQHAVRYGGLASPTAFQFWSFPMARLAPNVTLGYKPGERTLPLLFAVLNQSDSTFTLPEYYMVERAGDIYIPGLALWADGREGLNIGTTQLLDVSGFERHGTLSVNTLWQGTLAAPPVFLRFNGSTNSLSFGDVLDDDASGDFIIEAWLKFPTGGAQEEILSKKSLVTDNTAGFALYKTASNTIIFRLSSGSASATITSTSTVLTAWKHLFIAVDRNGNVSLYLNGASDATPVSVSAIGTGDNALNLYVGRDGTNYGQVDVGGLRVYRFAAGGLPSSYATIAATHYASERAYYGV